MANVTCIECGNIKSGVRSDTAKKQRFCSISCARKHHFRSQGRENHPSWKGGRRINHNGYVEIRMPDHPRARGNGYVFEHIIIAESKYGRPIGLNEDVHHKDEIKSNNYPDNLEVLLKNEHPYRHPPQKTGIYMSCEMCGETFYRKPSQAHEAKFCSRTCQGRHRMTFKNPRKK